MPQALSAAGALRGEPPKARRSRRGRRPAPRRGRAWCRARGPRSPRSYASRSPCAPADCTAISPSPRRCAQTQGRLPSEPEPRHVDGGPAPLGARLEVRRLLGLDEDDRLGAESGRVLPVRPGVELHEDDGALHGMSVEVGVLPGAAVEQVPAPALGPEGVGAHQVRPQRLQRDPLHHAAALVEQLQGGAVVHGHDDLVGLALPLRGPPRRAAPAPRSRRRSGRPGSRRSATRGRRAGGWCGRSGGRRRLRTGLAPRPAPGPSSRRKPGPATRGRPGP